VFIISSHGSDPLACSDSELTSETANNFRHFDSNPWRGIGPSQRLYLHRTAQRRKTEISNHAWSGNVCV